ncbi:hypothetical protein QJS66_22530 [Kocuria rhizophila]|nr:hypothetical protein QJS66_22530 [Kocuria rhizophila]
MDVTRQAYGLDQTEVTPGQTPPPRRRRAPCARTRRPRPTSVCWTQCGLAHVRPAAAVPPVYQFRRCSR